MGVKVDDAVAGVMALEFRRGGRPPTPDSDRRGSFFAGVKCCWYIENVGRAMGLSLSV